MQAARSSGEALEEHRVLSALPNVSPNGEGRRDSQLMDVEDFGESFHRTRNREVKQLDLEGTEMRKLKSRNISMTA